MTKVYTVTGATLYFESGRRRNIHFTAVVCDLAGFREKIRKRHGAAIVRLKFEERDEDNT